MTLSKALLISIPTFDADAESVGAVWMGIEMFWPGKVSAVVGANAFCAMFCAVLVGAPWMIVALIVGAKLETAGTNTVTGAGATIAGGVGAVICGASICGGVGAWISGMTGAVITGSVGIVGAVICGASI